MKPGLKTTEFWLTLLAQLGGLAMLIVGALKPESPALGFIGGILSLLPAPAYAVARSGVKKSENEAAALLSFKDPS